MNEPDQDILVVDDAPANLQVLVGALKARGYRVRPVLDGQLALDAARRQPPSLILLDIDMPGMDGLEVCARFKRDPVLAEIPVIFISALGDVSDKVRGFSAGGVDYLTKPFQLEEVQARVETQLTLWRQRRELEERLARLRELERLRDSLVHMIAHDLRAPLTVVTTNLEFLNTSEEIERRPEDHSAMVDALEASWRLVRMIDAMLDVSRIEASAMPLRLEVCDLAAVAQEAITGLAPVARDRLLTLELPVGRLPHPIDRGLILRVLQNLLGNALRFTPAGGRVALVIGRAEGGLRLRVTDQGPGIAVEHHAGIFEKYGSVVDPALRCGASTGLGLAFCKLAVEAHGGQIGVESQPGQGATFWFTLPAR